MNRALLRISLACLAMFVLLLLNVNYVQAFETTKLAGEPHNVRVFDAQFTYQRGAIIAGGDGSDVKIAYSKLIKGSDVYQRLLSERQGLRARHRLRHDLWQVRHRAGGEQPAERDRPAAGHP